MGIHQRDYMMREIDKIAKIIGYLIARIMGLGSAEELTRMFSDTETTLKTEIDFDLSRWLDLPDSDALAVLDEMKFEYEHFDKFIDLLMAMASKMPGDGCRSKKLYERCLLLDDYAGRKFGMTSFANYFRRQNIHDKIV